MKILVFSDSHRMLSNMKAVMDRLQKDIDVVIHLGDCLEDMMKFAKHYKNIAFYGVNGNCDFLSRDESEKIFTINNKKFFITHGHHYNVKSSYDRILYKASEIEADVCLFGHTHESTIFHKGTTLFMNPGSISLPKDNGGKPSYGVLDIDDNGSLSGNIVVKTGDHYFIKP